MTVAKKRLSLPGVHILASALTVLSLCVFNSGFAESQSTFHVATHGDDTNPGTLEKPFASLAKARDAVRAINADMASEIVVLIHPADYVLRNTLFFSEADSGHNGHKVIYRRIGKPGSARLLGVDIVLTMRCFSVT